MPLENVESDAASSDSKGKKKTGLVHKLGSLLRFEKFEKKPSNEIADYEEEKWGKEVQWSESMPSSKKRTDSEAKALIKTFKMRLKQSEKVSSDSSSPVLRDATELSPQPSLKNTQPPSKASTQPNIQPRRAMSPQTTLQENNSSDESRGVGFFGRFFSKTSFRKTFRPNVFELDDIFNQALRRVNQSLEKQTQLDVIGQESRESFRVEVESIIEEARKRAHIVAREFDENSPVGSRRIGGSGDSTATPPSSTSYKVNSIDWRSI